MLQGEVSSMLRIKALGAPGIKCLPVSLMQTCMKPAEAVGNAIASSTNSCQGWNRELGWHRLTEPMVLAMKIEVAGMLSKRNLTQA